MNVRRILGLTFALAALPLMEGCRRDGPAERTGEEIDEAVDNAGDELEEAGEKTEDGLEEAGEDVND